MIIDITDKKRFLVESLFIYNSLYHNRIGLASRFEKAMQSSINLRKRVLQDLIIAVMHNSNLLLDVIQSIKEICTIDDVIEYGFYQSKFANNPNDLHNYLKDLKYLRRDWSGIEQGEEEIKMIVGPLKNELKKHLVDNDSALFIGAGLGRIAWEHNNLFKKVWAIDKSYSMVYFFHKLLKENIEFYEINESNIYNSQESTKKYIASIQNGSKTAYECKERFTYIIGDVLSLPFDDQSQSAVLSVYFTDVLALRLYINEIIRVLKEGGLYIHFGPLAYFFGDIREKYSAEEIKEYFLSYGFEILHDELIDIPFMPVSYGLLNTVQTNWFFIARKKDTSNDDYIINESLYYRTKKSVSVSEESVEVELITKSGKVFEHAADVLRLLKYFEEAKSLTKGIKEILRDFPSENRDVISKTIDVLIKERLIINNHHGI